jgi:hypothetical protein
MGSTRVPILFALCVALAPAQSWSAPRSGGAALAAVVLPEAGDQGSQLRELLVEELEKRGIKVNRKPIPARIVARARGLAAYASAKRLKRVYELRVKPVGQAKLVVSLSEKKGRRLRASFLAKLPARSRAEVTAIIPQLVEAVVQHKEPVPPLPPAPKVATAAAPTSAQQQQQQISAVPTPAPPPVEQPAHGEFLFGFSLAPGMFLRSPSGLYGGSGQVYYQRGFYRVGLELGGMGGAGHLISFGARSQFLLAPSWKVVPVVGAGLGYLLLHGADNSDGGGGYFAATVGAQFNYVRWAKLVAELEFVLPMFSLAAYDPQETNGDFNIVKRSTWSPTASLKLSCLF